MSTAQWIHINRQGLIRSRKNWAPLRSRSLTKNWTAFSFPFFILIGSGRSRIRSLWGNARSFPVRLNCIFFGYLGYLQQFFVGNCNPGPIGYTKVSLGPLWTEKCLIFSRNKVPICNINKGSFFESFTNFLNAVHDPFSPEIMERRSCYRSQVVSAVRNAAQLSAVL